MSVVSVFKIKTVVFNWVVRCLGFGCLLLVSYGPSYGETEVKKFESRMYTPAEQKEMALECFGEIESAYNDNGFDLTLEKKKLDGVVTKYYSLVIPKKFKGKRRLQIVNKFAACKKGQSYVVPEGNACEDAIKEYDKEVTTFTKNCAKANYSSKKGGMCDADIRKCEECQLGSKEVRTSSTCDDVDIEGDTENLATKITGALGGQRYDSSSLREEDEDKAKYILSCSAYASVNLKDFRKDVRAEEKELKEIRKEIEEDQAAAQTEKEEMENTVENLQEEAKQAIKLAKTREEDIMELAGENERLMLEALAKLNLQLQQVEDKVREIALKEHQAILEYMNAVAQQKAECHRAALQKVAQQQEQAKALVSANIYSTGGFNSLMRSVGLSSRKKGQRRAKRYERECLNDSIMKAQLASFERDKRFKLKQAEAERVKASNAEKAIKAEIFNQRASAPKATQKALTALSKVQTELNETLNTIQGRILKAQQNGAQKHLTAQQKLLQKQGEYNQAKSYTANRRALLALREKSSGNRSTGDEAKGEAEGSRSDLVSKGHQVVRQCDCCTAGASTNPACFKAGRFIEENGQDPCQADQDIKYPSNMKPDKTGGKT